MARGKSCRVVYYNQKGRNPARQITRETATKILGEKKLKQARARACRQGHTSARPLPEAKHYCDVVIISRESRWERPL